VFEISSLYLISLYWYIYNNIVMKNEINCQNREKKNKKKKERKRGKEKKEEEKRKREKRQENKGMAK